MANRAYLFTADEIGAWQHLNDNNDGQYYDSRWCIPLAWFFFFSVRDVQLVQEEYGGRTWQEVKLVANKDAALGLFQARRPLFSALVRGIDDPVVTQFVQAVGRQPGKYLLLDPEEILSDGTTCSHQERFAEILRIIGGPTAHPERVSDVVAAYAGKLEPGSEKYLGQVFGYTYV